ncbi:hypothetical protein GQ457_14G008260 [Hibiscus cannabinus]
MVANPTKNMMPAWWISMKCHSNQILERGKLLTIEPENAGNYVLLSNIYATAGKWDKFSKLRLLENKGLKKIPGCSWPW